MVTPQNNEEEPKDSFSNIAVNRDPLDYINTEHHRNEEYSNECNGTDQSNR